MRAVVVGGAFGGLEFLRSLAASSAGFESVTLIDSRPEHSYTPLLHEGLTLRLSEQRLHRSYSSWVPRAFGAQFIHGFVRAVAPGVSGRVLLEDGREVPYDVLVIAAGSAHRLDGARHLGRVAHVSAVKFLSDLGPARSVLGLDHAPPRTVTVVGDGLTGVEHAAELAHGVRKRSLSTQIHLVGNEALPLPGWAPALRERTAAALAALGVHRTMGRVPVPPPTSEPVAAPEEVYLWATGTAPVAGFEGLPRTADGFIPVDQWLRVKVQGQVFALGDIARIHDAAGQVLPTAMRAAEAIFQGAWLGTRVATLCEGKPIAPYAAKPDFPFYGISLGDRAVFAYRQHGANSYAGALFRRFLMWGYWKRLGPAG